MKRILVLSLLLLSLSPIPHTEAATSFKRSPEASAARPPSGSHDSLTCSPAPCVVPNVLITAEQAYNTILIASPAKPSHLLAGLDSSYGGTCPFGSVNGGRSWYLDQNGRCAGATPSLAYGNEKTAYQVGSNYNSGVNIASTSDNGNTWNTLIEAVPPLFSGGSVSTPWLGVDNSAKSAYAKSLYITATQEYQVQSEITVSYSRDGGNTWTMTVVDKIQVEPKVDHYSRIAVASDGTVYVTWQRCEMTGKNVNCGGTKADMWLSKSVDGGNTWSSPARIAAVTLVPDSCNCAFYGNLPHTTDPVADPPLIAVDNSGGPNAGTLYVVVYDWIEKQMRVEVFSSQDGGTTWGKPVLVAPTYKNDEFFPGLSISAKGVVGVNWLDRRNDSRNIFYQPFAAVSNDGGKSFGTNYQLAKPLSNPYYSSYSMGDYTGNTWSEDTLFVAWPDTRNAIMQAYVGGVLTK